MKGKPLFVRNKLNISKLASFLAIVLAASFLIALSVILYERSIPKAAADRANQKPQSEQITENIPGDWLTQVQRNIRDSEYHITWQKQTKLEDLDAAWHAPNRAHNFRTYFTENGIRMIPRTEEQPSWKWDLSLTGYGRGHEVMPVEKAILSPDKNRIDYDRGDIMEWYINNPKGLKQGFTLSLPPEELDIEVEENRVSIPGARSSLYDKNNDNDEYKNNDKDKNYIYLVLSLSGTLSPVISADGQEIDFRNSSVLRGVHYSELKVIDANDRELPAWFEGFSESGVQGIRIVIDDSEAVYPITIDPLATSPSWTAESNQAQADFGNSVSTAGDVNGDGYADVIVGAVAYDNGDVNEGAAFVYHGSASGLSTTANWTAESNQVQAQFGNSVSTAGDVNGDGYADIIIGAHFYDNGESDEGRAYVYHGSASGLSTTANWTAESNQLGAEFGKSVSMAGDVNGDGYADVIVGAEYYDNGQISEGRAYAYYGSASGLSTIENWTAESNQNLAWFGGSVSTAGDVNGDGYADVIVGAHRFDNGQTDEGSAFVYHGSASGLSTTADWTAESNQDSSNFGGSVSTAGDVNGDGYADVIVGAYYFDNGQPDEGRAFVYHGSASGLSTTANWTAEGNQDYGCFGTSVSTAGDVNGDGYADVIVGTWGYDNGETDEGVVFVYHGSGSGLSTTANWTAESNQASAQFGTSVSTAGDVNGDGFSDVIIGAHFYDNGESDEGRAYVYRGSPAGLASEYGWTFGSFQSYAYFGTSVSTAGDVNGDRYADVIIGAPDYDNGEDGEGQAFVYFGSSSGLSSSSYWTAESDQGRAHFGCSVSTAGDVNGDGFSDVIIGADRYTNGETQEGRAYVYRGSSAGLSSTPSWTGESNQADANYGCSVATAGDVNGDGYSDVIIGAYRYDNGETQEGRAYVYHGSGSGLSISANWTAEINQGDAYFGFSVATAGDVDRDGYSDAIVGAYNYDNGETDEGQAYVYFGSSLGLSTVADWTAEGDQNGALFGYSVSTAGDVNGDGHSDIVIGAPSYDGDASDEGSAYVYQGNSSGLPVAYSWSSEGDQEGANFGNSVSTAGDVNGDGYADVIIGADLYERTYADEGRALVYHGSSSGLSSTLNWSDLGGQAHAYFGSSVSTAGDVNGDGYADIVVGARSYDSSGETNDGRAFAYYGNEGLTISMKPQQRSTDNSKVIAPLGISDSSDYFRIALLGRTPFGRGEVKLEWEAKHLGFLFDGLSTQKSNYWHDTGTTGTDLNEVVTNLTGSTVYHWRARLRYNPATTPLAQASRWITVPWNGWEEADLRTPEWAPTPAGRVPDQDNWPGTPLIVEKAEEGDDIILTWDISCLATDYDYEIYEGAIEDFYSHEIRYCSTGGATTFTLTPSGKDSYYIVVPRNSSQEGSYSTNSIEVERPQAVSACLPQEIGVCP